MVEQPARTTAPPTDGDAPGQSAKRPYYPGLDAYRAMGMLMVFLAHAYYASFESMRDTVVGRILDRFDIGLPMFFILSAFLLYRPFVVAQLQESPAPSYRHFLRNRIFRIIPAYWVALIALMVFGVLQPTSLLEAISFFSLVQIYDSARVFDEGFGRIYQSWSLATEMTFYLLLPVWAMMIRRWAARFQPARRVRLALYGTAALYVVGVLFRAFLIRADPSWQKQAILWLPTWLDMFAIGMALAIVSAHVATGGTCPRPIAWLGRHLGFSWLIALALFAVVTLYRPMAQPLALTGREYMTRQFLYGLIAAFWLIPSMFGDQSRGRIRAFLRHPVMVFLGAVSLSFYLYHVAILSQIEIWTGAAPFGNDFGELVGIGVPLTLAIAIASYYLVERPGLRMKNSHLKDRWRLRAHRADSAASPP
jgi:peptidoglycan/LPS O-acetylase OafA/YrhL